ncbi:GGDEF domain-containing protein [Catenovulum agarivorans DS-2]|uniref:diguanylate cyclase n=1 Tax=Catenovulum agarivorans DS-2 TaxID=1328313 RepID=W7Q6V0_9ALTE|nr:diguanylate cyclase [Catenovulum agarivorans]EWH08509.1 GGDEF domain-containing protein [Catenovulum agarivorans DS-2]
MDVAAVQSLLIERINSGVLVVDEECRLVYFNRFMESHSLLSASEVIGKNLFDIFPDAPKRWLQRKIQSVFMLNTPAFSSWEQRQFVFKMRHARPVTTSSEYMAQNITFIPICDKGTTEPDKVGIIVDDVTDVFFYQEKLKDTLTELEHVSRTDGLTKVSNRRYWEERFRVEFSTAQRHDHALSLIMFDLDKFKLINDQYGHQAGDLVLVEAANLVENLLRKGDLLGRYGGEEFGIILPNTNAQGAAELAERIRRQFSLLKMQYEKHTISATMSVGICECDSRFTRFEDMVTRADLALYQSKREGRNQVTIYQA